MRIILKSNSNILDKKFLEFLKKRMIESFADISSKKDTRLMTIYLNNNIFVDRHKFTTNQVLLMGLNNLKIVSSMRDGYIEIDPVKVVPYYHDLKITDVCSLVNKGNLDIKGTNILTDIFTYIKDNLDTLRTEYELGLN